MIDIKIINLKIHTTFWAILITILLAIFLTFISLLKIIKINSNGTIIMTNDNYTTILNDCHNNLENYINKKISMTGYVFKMNDFNDAQFVVARDMIINDSEYRIVGFLCEYKKAHEFEENSWVNIEGIITEGNYNGKIPVIKIIKIKNITTPNDVFVYPPNVNSHQTNL